MPSKQTKCGVDLGLTDAEKSELLRIAREAIVCRCQGKPVAECVPSTETLKELRGAFVSLHKKGMLRGCIGTLEARSPLWKCVEEMAQAAAFRDPRFRPVTADELPHLDLEISVLTPFTEIEDPEEIQVGLHGLLIRKGSQGGLLLPQVAAERDWDRITFLQETCRKAGLHPDAWKEKDTTICVFSADVFPAGDA
jgi:AmmeMemoRadiSam system protein A